MSMLGEVTRIIRRYGTAHADTYGDLRWERDHFVVTFTAQLDEHRGNLRSLVGDMSLVEVEATRHTSAHLAEIVEAVRREFQDDGRRILGALAPGHVTVRAQFADIAADLHRRYGDALDITVGSWPFPPDSLGVFRAVPVPASTVDLKDLDVEFDFETLAVAAGDELRGIATLTNSGPDRLQFLTGPVTGGVRHPGADMLAGVFEGAVTPAGFNIDLRHGATRELPLIVGATSCLPDRSYTVPAGAYEVVATLGVDFRDGQGRTSGPQSVVRIGPTITVG